MPEGRSKHGGIPVQDAQLAPLCANIYHKLKVLCVIFSFNNHSSCDILYLYIIIFTPFLFHYHMHCIIYFIVHF